MILATSFTFFFDIIFEYISPFGWAFKNRKKKASHYYYYFHFFTFNLRGKKRFRSRQNLEIGKFVLFNEKPPAFRKSIFEIYAVTFSFYVFSSADSFASYSRNLSVKSLKSPFSKCLIWKSTSKTKIKGEKATKVVYAFAQ